MLCLKLLLFFLIVGGSWRHVRCTCVLESEFGFALNCTFKKSGLFRVRNLGGIKAHVGLGISLGDELGFRDSLSNVENNRRRSTQNNRFQNAFIQQSQQTKTANNKLSQNQRLLVKAQPAVSSVAFIDPKREMHVKNPVTVPPFKPIPPAAERPVTVNRDRVTATVMHAKPARVTNISTPALVGVAVPAFQSMPSSISRISSSSPAENKVQPMMAVLVGPQSNVSDVKKLSSSNLALRTLPAAPADLSNALQEVHVNPVKMVQSYDFTTENPEPVTAYRQPVRRPVTTTTKRPMTFAPKRHLTSPNKVMNAPKEYYPVGYDKNFDDNFSSRVELPDTSFYCGDQKHFPGLYADEDLGCMVFHVCALTDDGLIMKSFLCPESTLFDQTILKCNWWFYVDCKNSKRMYDSNIPVSKSYQLMKALTFFSSYKKESTTTGPTNGIKP